MLLIKRCNLLQSIALESSDGKYSDSEFNEVNNVIADIQNEEDSSDSDDAYINQEVPTNTDGSARAQTSSDNDDQTLLSKYGSHWQRSVSFQVTAGRLQQHYIVRIRAGSTPYSTFRIIHCNPFSLEKEFGKG